MNAANTLNSITGAIINDLIGGKNTEQAITRKLTNQGVSEKRVGDMIDRLIDNGVITETNEWWAEKNTTIIWLALA